MVDIDLDFRIVHERQLFFRLTAELPCDFRLFVFLNDGVRRRRFGWKRQIRASGDANNQQEMRPAKKHRLIIVSLYRGSNSDEFERALEEALSYSRTHRQFGRALAEFQATRFKLA